MKDKKLILFDLDDTLYSFHDLWDRATKHIFKTSQWTSTLNQSDLMEVYLAEDKKLWEFHKQNSMTLQELRIVRYVNTFLKFGIKISHDESGRLFESFMMYLLSLIHPQIEVHNLLRYLISKYKVGIVTNGAVGEQTEKIKRLGIDNFISVEYVFISDRVGFAKPDSRIFLHACSKFDISPADTVFVGDSLFHDVHGALQSGLNAIWYTMSNSDKPNEFTTISNLEQLYIMF